MRIPAIDRCLGACLVIGLASVVSAAPADQVERGAREIQQIVVITDRAFKGRYTVNGEAGHGGVASR